MKHKQIFPLVEHLKNEPHYTFWIENKQTNERRIGESEIVERFKTWLIIKGKDWVEYYDRQTVVTSFITEKTGMNATFEFKKVDDLVALLTPYIKEFIQ